MKDQAETRLDTALARGEAYPDMDIEPLVQVAHVVENAFDAAEPEGATRARGLFVQGVASRRRPAGSRLLVPGIAIAGLIALLVIGARTALPGQALYPVRKALGQVGLVRSAAEEVRELVDAAERQVVAAEALLEGDRARAAQTTALDALVTLREATALLDEVGPQDGETLGARIHAIARRATAVVVASSVLPEATSSPTNDADNSGLGSSNSGEESGDSGEGSGNDQPSENNSGPGSGDDEPDDDSSGPGSGDDEPDEDNSGRGSTDEEPDEEPDEDLDEESDD